MIKLLVIFVLFLIAQSSAFLDIRGIRCERFANDSGRMDFFARDDPESWSIDFRDGDGHFDPVASRSGLKIDEQAELFTELFGYVVSWVQIVEKHKNRHELYLLQRHNTFESHFNLIHLDRINYTSKVASPGNWWTKEHIYYHMTHAIDHNCNYRWFFYGIHWFWLKATIYLYTNPESDDWTYRRRLQAYFNVDRIRYSKFILTFAKEYWTLDEQTVAFYADAKVGVANEDKILNLDRPDDESLLKDIRVNPSDGPKKTNDSLYLDEVIYPVPWW